MDSEKILTQAKAPETLLGRLPRELRQLLVEYLPKYHLFVEAHLSDMAPLVSAECKEKSRELLCNYAARNGCLSLLQWARLNSCCWEAWTCFCAASGGHLAVLQWARQNACPWDESTCTGAAAGGHLAVLRWSRQNGCPWNGWTCANAAAGGYLAVLQWLRQNGCPWNRDYCISSATKNGHGHVVDWIRTQPD
jgi:hypothetical protein